MVSLTDRRVVAGASLGVLLLVTAAAAVLLHSRSAGSGSPAARDRTALKVQQGDDAKAASGAPLRCFVDGRFVGSMSIANCAQKNGVSSQGLDVGVASGATPPVPVESGSDEALPSPERDGSAAPDRARAGMAREADDAGDPGRSCLRYAGGSWRPVGAGMPLGVCVHALYQGRCVSPGEALYGRYGDLTLRLVPGGVESSDDDRRFHPLISQSDDCTLDE